MTHGRERLPGTRRAQRAAPAGPGNRPSAATSLLALQRLAGNRSTAQLLQRKPKDPEPDPAPLDAHGDFAAALKHVGTYYDGVRSLLELEDKVREQAFKNFKDFGELKDPPSIAGAVFAEIFSQVVGLIPGGKLVTATVSAGVFAVQLTKLEKDLNGYAYPGVSVEDEAERGPSERTKAKVEKVYGHGKTAVEAGKAVVGAGLKAAKEKAAASAAEAAAQENAAMGGKRISKWREATELSFLQEQAITDQLELAHRKGADPGKLKELAVKQLGPRPKLTEQLQDQLEREYELALYREKLRLVTVNTTHYLGGVEDRKSTATRLELAEGGRTSLATRRRIAAVLRLWHLADYEESLGHFLGVKRTQRESQDRRPAETGRV